MNQYFKGWKQLNNEAVIANIEKEYEQHGYPEGHFSHPQFKKDSELMPDNLNF